MNPGDRVLVRDRPLLGPLIVEHVRTHFAGEPEPNGPVFCHGEDAPARFGVLNLRRYDQCELVPCPPEYEPAPASDKPWLTLRWINRNRPMLEAVHGIDALESAEKQVRLRIILDERIGTALAAEPEATAGASALGEIFTMDEFVQSERQ